MADPRHDIGETQPERIEREEDVADTAEGKARRDIIVVGALVIGLTTVGWYTTGKFADDLRDSTVAGCERQNEVRAEMNVLGEVVRESLRSSIELRFAAAPEAAPIQQAALIEAARRDRANLDEITELTPTDCEAKYPD